MNRMEGIEFNRNRQNMHSFEKFLARNPMQPLTCADMVVLRSPPS